MDPTVFEDYVGQQPILDQLLPELQAATMEGRPVRHLIFYSVPGLGKDHLVNLIAKALGVAHLNGFVQILGSDIARAGRKWTWDKAFDMFNPFDPDINEFGKLIGPWVPRIVFINECEQAPRAAMEEIHGVLQPGPDGSRYYMRVINAKHNISEPVWAPPFTLIMATNFFDELIANCPAVVDRCPLQFEFQFYTPEDLAKIVAGFSESQKVPISPAAALGIGQRSKGSPRQALQALWPAANNERVINQHDKLTIMHVQTAMKRARIAEDGLDAQDVKYLRLLSEHGNQSGVGLTRLASLMGLPVKIITQTLEPWLNTAGFTSVDSTGRILTRKGLVRLNATGQVNLRLIERAQA
jgi:Holliday junction DNA helicase RuvB